MVPWFFHTFFVFHPLIRCVEGFQEECIEGEVKGYLLQRKALAQCGMKAKPKES